MIKFLFKGGSEVNVNMLRGKIIEKGFTIGDVADFIEINRSSLYRKLEITGTQLSISEANDIVIFLGLTKEETTSIFFSGVIDQ